MFTRLLFESFRRQARPKALVLLVLTLGMSICTAMFSIATDVGDKMNQDLRTSSGANLIITPGEDNIEVNVGGIDLKPAKEGKAIHESDLPGIKGIFWGHNILGFAPFLSGWRTFVVNGQAIQGTLTGTYFSQPVQYGGESFVTGVQHINKFWKVVGEWPSDEGRNVLVGADIASRARLHVGDKMVIKTSKADVSLTISGILNSGSAEDQAVVAPLHLVQQILERPGAVQKVLVSALTKPEDAFARQDPNQLSGAALEKWSCSPYANSIAYQIQELLPGTSVEQIRQVEQNQGRVLSRISLLMLLLALATLTASTLAIFAIVAATVIQRRHTIGLLKSLGGGNGAVASLFLSEAALLGLAGGAAGFGLGAILAWRMGQIVFGSAVNIHPVVFVIVLCTAVLVAFAGSAGAIRKAMQVDPAMVLRGAV